MILMKTKRPFKSEIRKELVETYGKKFTGEQVLAHLFGDSDGWINSDYQIRKYCDDKRTILNRINYLWVLPVYILFIAPVRWVLAGDAGLKKYSKLYNLITWLIGEPY